MYQTVYLTYAKNGFGVENKSICNDMYCIIVMQYILLMVSGMCLSEENKVVS